MKKIEIYKNVNAISNTIDLAGQVQVKLNNFYQYVTGLGYPLTIEQINSIYFDLFGGNRSGNADYKSIATLFLKGRISEKNSNSIQGLGFATNKTELFKLIQVNETEVQGITEHISNFIQQESGYFQYLEFVPKTNSIELVHNYKTQIAESHTIYATNDRQIKAVELFQMVADSLNNIDAIFNFRKQEIDGLIYINKSYQIDPHYIKQISQ